MSATPEKELHLTLCGCPHVNIVITDGDRVLAHFATTPEKALAIAEDIRKLAEEGIVMSRLDKVGVPEGRA